MDRFIDGSKSLYIYLKNIYCFHVKAGQKERSYFSTKPEKGFQMKISADDNSDEIQRFITDMWTDVPLTPRNSGETSKLLTKYFESDKPFTIILPFHEKALWADEVLDRLIDHPIPIPSRGQHLVIACRIG